jgi:hypothetical protein
MCATCDKAKGLPLDQALKLVQQEMQQRENRSSLAHLDNLLGDLIGMPEPKVDREAEGTWESRRRGRRRGR